MQISGVQSTGSSRQLTSATDGEPAGSVATVPYTHTLCRGSGVRSGVKAGEEDETKVTRKENLQPFRGGKKINKTRHVKMNGASEQHRLTKVEM